MLQSTDTLVKLNNVNIMKMMFTDPDFMSPVLAVTSVEVTAVQHLSAPTPT